MFTSYRMYDLREVEVIADKRRQLRAIDAPESFEGVRIKVSDLRRAGGGHSFLRSVLMCLLHSGRPAVQPLRRQPERA